MESANPPHPFRVEQLSATHDRQGFRCGVEALDRYIQQQAGQDAKRNTATVFVLTSDSHTIVGFYTLSALSIPCADIPLTFQKKLPRTPIPATLLGRMAVSESHRGQRLGGWLLMNALHTAYLASQTVASWAVVVDAKQGAKDFYLKYGFAQFLDDGDRLFLPMTSIANSTSIGG